MNSYTNHPIDSVVEAVCIITWEVAYASFLSLDDLNILVHVVVHHLRPTPIGIVKSWHACTSKKLHIEKNVDNINLNGIWRFSMNQKFGISFTIIEWSIGYNLNHWCIYFE